MTVLNINLLAVVVGAVWFMVLGYLWYGPLFGKMWMEAMGTTEAELAASTNMAQTYGIATVVALVANLGLAMLISAAGVHNLVAGITIGAIAGVGLVATSVVSGGLFERKKWSLTILYACYQIVALVVSGAIIGFWP